MDDLDSVILDLKACLISTKGGIQLSQIESKLLKYFFLLDNLIFCRIDFYGYKVRIWGR